MNDFTYRKECIWSLLTGFLTQSNSPRIIQFIKELEMWILRLLSTPVPVPGKTKLEVRTIITQTLNLTN